MKLANKGKSIPMQACRGPEGSRSLELSDFKTISTVEWSGHRATTSHPELFLLLIYVQG